MSGFDAKDGAVMESAENHPPYYPLSCHLQRFWTARYYEDVLGRSNTTDYYDTILVCLSI